MGLDLGTKTIGLAVSDSDWSVASPLYTIRRVKFTPDVEAMLAIAARESVAGLVLGLPLNMDETEGPRAQATRAFARNLAKFTDLPLLFWDERLTSEEAYDAMRAAGIPAHKHKELVDQVAASIILQSALEALAAPNINV